MIVNRQRRVRVSTQALDKFLRSVLRRLRLPADGLTISCVSNSEMARWNRTYRGKKRATDVLSFPVDAVRAVRREGHRRGRGRAEVSARGYLGDIAIAPAVARENARRLGRSFDDEMRILILHGVLHLMGYDHEADSGQMERFERRLRHEWRIG
jgi:probable rRNA maturation factor